jgi:hypothetical protein
MNRPVAALMAFVLFAALACNLAPAAVDPNAASTAVAQTVAAGQTSTAAVLSAAATLAASSIPPTAGPTDTPEVSPTPSDTPTPSATPTPVATATPSIPIASLTQNTNCRGGPLAIYDLIRTFLIGESAQITGKDAAGDYWYVTDPSQPGKDCWLWGRYVTVSGDTSKVPVFTPPPTPTPAYVWSGKWSAWIAGTPGSMTMTQTGTSVTGTLSATGVDYDLTGTVSEGGRTLTGTVTSIALPQPVPWTFRMTSNMQQFRGHYTVSGTDYPWCGARAGGSQPSPCMGP